MIGKLKPFSKSLHRSNDPKSRKVVKEYLKQRGIEVEDNKDKYGVDLVATDGSMKIEVEHRSVWDTKIFPFDTVNIPERKGKFFKEKSVSYAISSKDYSRIGMIKGEELKKHLIRENLYMNPNKYVKKGEYFYAVPLEAFQWDSV